MGSGVLSFVLQPPSSLRGAEGLVFFSSEGEYSEFFNSAPYAFHLDGYRWPSVEHYFQAQKVGTRTDLGMTIRSAGSAKEAFRLGRSVALPAKWRIVREEVMMRALYAKFSQNQPLAELLLSTGDRKIIEQSTRDSFWAAGPDGKGQNKLGRLLEEIREQLRLRCAALEDEGDISRVPISAQNARRELEDELRLLPLEAFSRLRHFQPQTGCLNSCAFCSQSAGVAIWQLPEASLRNVIAALKLTALEKARRYVTPDGKPYVIGAGFLSDRRVFSQDFVMPPYGLLGYDRLNHRPGVLFCYLDNDISCYPYLDKFLQFCADDLGVRVRISTVGYSRHNVALRGMHSRIAGQLSRAIAGIRFSFTPYTAGWRPTEDQSELLSREEFEQDFANALRTYKPTLSRLGTGKRTAAVELRFAPHLVAGELRQVQSPSDNILVCGPYVVRSSIPFSEMQVSTAATDGFDHLVIDGSGADVDVIRDASVASVLFASRSPLAHDWSLSRRGKLFRFENDDGDYYSLNPNMREDGTFAKHFYPKTKTRRQSGYIDAERYFMNTILAVKASYGIYRAEPFEDATWQDADDVITRIRRESVRLTQSDRAASTYIREEVLPLAMSYLRSIKLAALSPSAFFDPGFTIDTGTICNLGRAYYLFKGLVSLENRPLTTSHEKSYGTRSSLARESSVWRICVSPSIVTGSAPTGAQIGGRNTLAPRTCLAIEELHLDSTSTADGQLQSRVLIPVEGVEQISRSAIRTGYIVPGQKPHA